MNSKQIKQLRQDLYNLTAELASLGVTTLTYHEENIASYSPGVLKSCIEWASGTIEHVREVRSLATV